LAGITVGRIVGALLMAIQTNPERAGCSSQTSHARVAKG